MILVEQAHPVPKAVPTNELTEKVLAHLRAIAQRQMALERPGHSLTATALVNEAFLKLAPRGMPFDDKAQFYYAAAQAMRRLLIDHARRRKADKRRHVRASLQDLQNVADLAKDDNLESVMALERAYTQLEADDPEAAGVVRLRFFAGLTGDQAAEVLGISSRQGDRAWKYARAFLASRMRRPDEEASD
jgi:RNA polymerase sigma factor (TIGR02999 family)